MVMINSVNKIFGIHLSLHLVNLFFYFYVKGRQ